MKKNSVNLIKAIVIDIMIAFLIVILYVLLLRTFLGSQIDMAVSLLNKITINAKEVDSESKIEIEDISGTNKLKNYPAYGQKYATLKIESASIDLPVYFGDSLEVLKNGVGHSSGSYFPGEGGSIIYCAHNSKDKFRNFSKIKKGDIVNISTDYGEFKYKVYDMQVIEETEQDKMPVQKDEEKLMMYTCYPFDALGYTTKRYVVYANLIS